MRRSNIPTNTVMTIAPFVLPATSSLARAGSLLLAWCLSLLMLLPGTSLRAQCPVNTPAPCAGVAWQNYTASVVLSSGCVVYAAYRVRKCPPPNTFCEIALDGITATFRASNCLQCDPFLEGMSIQQITDEVLRYILARNRGTAPCNPYNRYRIGRMKCWRNDIIAGYRVFTPCGGCCTFEVTVNTTDGLSTVLPLGPAIDTHCTPPGVPPPCIYTIPCPPDDTPNWLFNIPTP